MIYQRLLNFISKLAATTILLSLGAISPSWAEIPSIKVGVTAGSSSETLEVVKKEAEKLGLHIEIVEFNDYIQPNATLAAGELDANSFQHQPYLDAANASRNYNLVSIANTSIAPIGVYSKKIKSLAELKKGDRIAIPNDPTNGARALLLLEKQGVIKLKKSANIHVTPLDITDNPHNLNIVELDAAQLPRSLDDVTAAAINTNYALHAQLHPKKDSIAIESVDSPYVNVIAVRAQDKDRPEFKKLIQAYHNDTVKKFILEKYEHSVIPSW